MNQFWLKAFLTIFILGVSLSIKPFHQNHIIPSDEKRIINGRRVHISEVPYLVQILDDPFKTPICGGVLVASKRVITAGHCVYDINNKSFEDQLYIRYGTSLKDSSPYPVESVSRIILHRGYSEPENITINDIAVLILQNSISKSSKVDFARLPTFEFDGIFQVSVYGWGHRDVDEPKSDALLKATMITKRSRDCVEEWNPGCQTEFNCQHICAIADSSGSGEGDSGGPVVLGGTVVGLVSLDLNFSETEFGEFEPDPPNEERLFQRTFYHIDFINARERNHIEHILIP